MTSRPRRRPSTPYPPAELEDLIASVGRHPEVATVGLTTTEAGEWALYVRLRHGVESPDQSLRDLSQAYPVVYDHEADRLPLARPAYPARGE